MSEHRGYDAESEDEKYRREKIIRQLDTSRKTREIIDTWSKEAGKAIKTREDFDQWVQGLIKLYAAASQ